MVFDDEQGRPASGCDGHGLWCAGVRQREKVVGEEGDVTWPARLSSLEEDGCRAPRGLDMRHVTGDLLDESAGEKLHCG